MVNLMTVHSTGMNIDKGGDQVQTAVNAMEYVILSLKNLNQVKSVTVQILFFIQRLYTEQSRVHTNR
jgi:hypothetical protein